MIIWIPSPLELYDSSKFDIFIENLQTGKSYCEVVRLRRNNTRKQYVLITFASGQVVTSQASSVYNTSDSNKREELIVAQITAAKFLQEKLNPPAPTEFNRGKFSPLVEVKKPTKKERRENRRREKEEYLVQFLGDMLANSKPRKIRESNKKSISPPKNIDKISNSLSQLLGR